MTKRQFSHNYNYYVKQVAALRRCCLFLAIGFLSWLFTACSGTTEEEFEDTYLPVQFTATVLGDNGGISMGSRATMDNTWGGGESVAICMNGTTKKYVAATDGGLSPDSGETSHTWMSGSGTTIITAWSPYQTSMEKFTIDTGQTTEANLQKNDFIYAYSETSYTENIPLTFKHLTAKLIFHIKSSEFATDEEIQGGTLRIKNQPKTSGTVHTDGSVDLITVTASNYQIAPRSFSQEGYPRNGMALVVPQTIKDVELIELAAGGKTFQYTPSTWMTFQAGYQYSYEVTLSQDKLTLVTTGITPWGSDEESETDLIGDVGKLKPTPSVNPWTGTDMDLTTYTNGW